MSESYIRVPDDTGYTGKKVRTNQRTVGANDVEEHFMALIDPSSGDALNATTEGTGKALDAHITNATIEQTPGAAACSRALVIGGKDTANNVQILAQDTAGRAIVNVNSMPAVSITGTPTVNVTSSSLPSGASTSAKQDTIIGHVDGIETLLGTIDTDTSALAGTVSSERVRARMMNALVPSEYDYIALSWTGDNLTGVVFKTGGSGGTTVATLTLAYTGSVLDSVTRT